VSDDLRPKTSAPFLPLPAATGWRRGVRTAENLLTALVLAVLMLLPLEEIVMRKWFHSGLTGATAFEQHLVLIIGLLGGMLAARDRRLLSLSTLTNFLKDRWQSFARIFSSAFAAGITVFLCVGAAQLVQSVKEDEKMLAYGIPVWLVQLIMPAGFGVIAIRLLWHAAETWRGRLVALALAAALVWIGFHPLVTPDKLVLPGLLTLLAAVVLGAPIFVMLGGAALILFWGQDQPITAISLTHYSIVTNPTLPTVPLFTLAGYFLAEGGASKRLIRVFNALLGQFRGGPAIVTVLACAFFTSFTGASGVTILALGGLLLPVLMAAGYSERSSLGLVRPFCWWPWPLGWAFALVPKEEKRSAPSTGSRPGAPYGRPNGNCSCRWWRWSRSLADGPRRSKPRLSPPAMPSSSRPSSIGIFPRCATWPASWPSAAC